MATLDKTLGFKEIAKLSLETIVVVTRDDVTQTWELLSSQEGEITVSEVGNPNPNAAFIGLITETIRKEDIQSGVVKVRLATQEEIQAFEKLEDEGEKALKAALGWS